MVGRYVSPRTAVLAGMMVSLGACNINNKPKVDKHLEDAIAAQQASQAVNEAIQKETAPPTVRAKRNSGSHALGAGESIWIQEGKSRVLNVPYTVQRVSIGNPDLAGVVVLGPKSILVNAKELPKDTQATGGGVNVCEDSRPERDAVRRPLSSCLGSSFALIKMLFGPSTTTPARSGLPIDTRWTL